MLCQQKRKTEKEEIKVTNMSIISFANNPSLNEKTARLRIQFASIGNGIAWSLSC